MTLILFFTLMSLASAKATRASPPLLYSADLVVQISESPRPELESAITLNAKVRACLRDALKQAGDDFALSAQGEVGEDGQLAQAKVQTLLPPPLTSCLEGALNALKLKYGLAGHYSVNLARQRTPGNHAKTLRINLNEGEKLE